MVKIGCLPESFAAYFEDAQESAFGMIDRQGFEDRLRAHSPPLTADDDPAWYALRHAVFATGARMVLSRTSSFQVASEVSWALFGNAFSVHSELAYFKSSLMAIQALTVMVRLSRLGRTFPSAKDLLFLSRHTSQILPAIPVLNTFFPLSP